MSQQETFTLIKYDCRQKSLIQAQILVNLKTLIDKLLPMIGQKQIVKNMFDGSHSSIVILENQASMVPLGGCVFKVFKNEELKIVDFNRFKTTRNVRR